MQNVTTARNPADYEQTVPLLRRLVSSLTAAPPVAEGIDLNFNQKGELDDAYAVFASGRRFAIVEAAWGLYEPATFAEFWPPLLDAGIFLMAYLFFRGDQSGVDQAHFVLEATRPMFEAQGCRSVIFSDVERFSFDSSTPAIRIPRWHDFNGEIHKEMRAGVYSNIPSWRDLMENEPLPDDVIGWAAHHTPYWESFLVPNGWRKEQVLFLQDGIARVHGWRPAVPGISGDVSCDKFFGVEEQLYRLCDDLPPAPPPGGNMPTLLENIERAQELSGELSLLLDEIHQQAQDEPPAPPPPEPPPPAPTDITIRVTDDPRANARYSRRNNDAGRPIMEIYPSDSAPARERIQFRMGTLLKAKQEKVIADGGLKFWQLTERVGRGGETLYLRDVDASKT